MEKAPSPELSVTDIKKFTWPSAGRISAWYGMPAVPFSHTKLHLWQARITALCICLMHTCVCRIIIHDAEPAGAHVLLLKLVG